MLYLLNCLNHLEKRHASETMQESDPIQQLHPDLAEQSRILRACYHWGFGRYFVEILDIL